MYERIKIINGQKYRYLVKGVRVGGKVKQVFVKYLGKVPDEEYIEAQGSPESGDLGADE